MPRPRELWTQTKTRATDGWRRSVAWAKGRKWVPGPTTRRRMAWGAGIAGGSFLALILVLGLVDWNYLKGPVEGVISARMGRAVRIDGDLDVKLISWTPGATLQGLRVSNPAFAGGGDMTRIERLAVQVKLLPLLRGRVILPLLQVDHPQTRLVRLADGRNNWTFGGKTSKPFAMPPVRRFEIRDGDLTISDAVRRLEFSGTINSSEIADADRREGFHLTGEGSLNKEPFHLQLVGGPLLNVDPNRPYPFDADLRAGDTHIAARGSIPKPFNLGLIDTTLAMSGPDLADLYYLTGLALPNTPPYAVQGRLTRRNALYSYDGLTGRIGDSDIAGRLGVRTGGARLYLSGDLASRKLDFDDLRAIIGGGARTTAAHDTSPKQASTERTLAATGRMMPDTPLRVERLRRMDADVTYRAASISADHFPARAGSVTLALKDGVLDLDPLTLDLTNGRLGGAVRLNASGDVPAVNADLRLSGAHIDEFLPVAYRSAISGPIYGHLRLAGAGASMRDVAATADGQVSLVIPQGEMREALAELLGVNLLRGLFTDPKKTTTLRCAVADFKVTNGVMNAQTIVLDTGPVVAVGGGTVNLKTEQLALRVKGHAKEPRFVRLAIPFELKGPLRRPAFSADTGSAVGQGGIAAALASLISPIAAILPFVDPGLADDANCKALVAQAGTGHPAPAPTTAEADSPRRRG